MLNQQKRNAYIYIRCSTKLQDTQVQHHELLQYAKANNLNIADYTEEIISSRVPLEQRKISHLIKELPKGSILLITELSRLGRTITEIMSLLNTIISKDIELHITKSNTIYKNDIQSQLLAFAYSLSAQIERDLISMRTKESLAAKKASGVKLGRPKGSTSKSKLDGKEEQIKMLLDKRVSINSICKILEVATPTFYNFCKSRNIALK